MSDKRYLDKHGNQWRVQVRIPPKLQPVIGKKKLIHPLHTDSLANANRLKWDVVARLKAQIRAAEKGSDSSADPLTAEAMSWRADIEREKPPVIEVQDAETGEPIEVDSPVLPDLLLERAQEIAEAHGPDKAEVFYKAAIGQATPVTALIDPWLTERADMKERQRKDYRRAVEKFAAWSTVAIEGVTRKVAGRYVSEEMVQKGKHPKTANKDISCLSSYWRWLIKRGHVEANPWLNQSLSKKLAPKITKRPFTDDEVSRLIGGTRNLFLLDLMQMGALSGMRLEEIASLSVADVADKEFNILDAKTKAGIRTLPIHSALLPIIKRRVKSKKPSDFLFEEMGDARDGAQERGQIGTCLLYTSPSPRDRQKSRMPSSA